MDKQTIKRMFEEREAELASEIERLQRQLQAVSLSKEVFLESEDANYLEPDSRDTSSAEVKAKANTEAMARRVRVSFRRRSTIKTMVMNVLHDSDEALTAEEILKNINYLHGTRLARTSLSPQLSRLKAEGRIVYDPDTRRWGTIHHLPQISYEPNSENS